MNYAVEPSEAVGMSARRLERVGPAMQAYVDWEYGLVEQLRRDATHGFFVI